jgi:hypothetical protein
MKMIVVINTEDTMKNSYNNINDILFQFHETLQDKDLSVDDQQEIHIKMLQALNNYYRDHGKYPNNELIELHGMLVGRYGWILKSRAVSEEQFKKEEGGPCIW